MVLARTVTSQYELSNMASSEFGRMLNSNLADLSERNEIEPQTSDRHAMRLGGVDKGKGKLRGAFKRKSFQ